MNCTGLINPDFAQVTWCALTMAIGSEVMVGILLFAVFMYGIYMLKLSFQSSIILGLLTLFVFAGAGITSQAIGGGFAGGQSPFTTMMWIAVIGVGAIIALFFWGLRR